MHHSNYEPSAKIAPHARALCILAILILSVAASVVWAAPTEANRSTTTVVLAEGRSTLMHFQRMKRVEVVEPDLMEVVVASINDLSLYAKKAGQTTIYVWDLAGLHQIEVTISGNGAAQKLLEDLRRILPATLTYTLAGDQALMIEGTLSAAEADRARTIIAAAAKADVKIVDLIHTEGEASSGAVALAESLRKVLGERLQYVVWNNNTLLVQGALGDQTEVERARKLLTAAGNHGVNIVDLIEMNPSAGTAPVEEIAKAVGDRFHVWQIQGSTVGIEGVVASPGELADLNKILDNFSGQAKLVNLVRVVEPKPDINEVAAMLQKVLGDGLVARPLDGQSIVLEGVVGSDQELSHLRDTIGKVPVSYQLVDLLHVGIPDKRQIVCHVRICDINKGNLERLGVNWGQIAFDGTKASFVDQPWLIANLRSGLLGGGALGAQNVFSLGSQIDALAQQNEAQILAEPNLMVDDGGKANILVGGEIPVPISQPGGGGVASVTVDWKTFGVKLELAPVILEGGNRINMLIAPEVSSLDAANSVTIAGFTLPALRTRSASTQVTMTNGDTLILGGLLQSEDTKAIRKIPLLGDLPIIGKLFQRKEFTTGKSELVITVTPEIIQRKCAKTGTEPFH